MRDCRSVILMKVFFWTALLVSGLTLVSSRNLTGIYDDDEQRLLKDLFSTYDKKLRPVMSKHKNVTVKFGMTLNQIMDVIEKFELISLSLNVRQNWENPLLAWNASEYGGIKLINVEPGDLWKPDLYLYNNADSGYDGSLYGFTAKIKISDTGSNAWLAPKIFTTSCKINVKYFPFDQQECYLKFGSWTYDANSVDIVSELNEVSTKGYQKNGEWDFVKFPCKRNVVTYVCCPDNPYTDVTCTLHIRRKTMYYWVNLIIPCLLITVLSLLSFLVSTESGERIGLVITDLLALTVFMLIVADLLPPTSEVVPVISIYITCSIVEVGLALVATCIVVQCYHTNPDINEMPFWMQYFICQKLGSLLGIRRVNERKEEEEIKEAEGDDKTDIPRVEPRNRLFGFWNLPPAKTWSYEQLIGTSEAEATCKICLEARANAIHESKPASSFVQHAAMYKPFPPYSSNSLRKRSLYEEQMDAGSSVEANQPEPGPSCACASDPTLMRMLKAVVHRQDHVVEGVAKLINTVDDQDESSSKRDEWIFAATVIDRFFLILFSLVIAISTALTFAMIPSYDDMT